MSDEEYGPNREAVEAMLADLDERGRVGVTDGPLVAQARSLASAVDGNPGSSQLAMQYRAILEKVRSDVERTEAEIRAGLGWSIKTGCDIHPPIDAHCGECCALTAGLAEVDTFEPPSRWYYEGRSNGRPSREMSDVEYARAVISAFLQRRRGIRIADAPR